LRSAAERFEFDFDRKKLFRRLQAAVANKREPQRVRVELWADGRTRIETAPLLPESASWRLSLADEKVDPKELWLFFKTTLRGRYDRALAAARASGADEAVFLNTEGLLTEGTRTNLFVKLEGRWWTPPLESGLLPGVYRQHLLQTGKVRERALRLEDLARAEGLAVGNALRGWIPAVRWFPLREGT
jgi:para-aminobenzoate synthetase/4-amino-4-deoxychorismate lyase